jgi:hypothetical protein
VNTICNIEALRIKNLNVSMPQIVFTKCALLSEVVRGAVLTVYSIFLGYLCGAIAPPPPLPGFIRKVFECIAHKI